MMKKKYFVLVLTFLCMLCGNLSYSQVESEGNDEDFCFECNNELGEVIIPGTPDSHDPCDLWSSSYDFYVCHGMTYGGSDSGDPCDPFSSVYNLSECIGDSGDPCDLFSYTYDPSICSGENVIIQGTDDTNNPGKDYIPKSTDKLVKEGIITTCEKHSTLPVCVIISLEITFNNVLGLTVTNKEICTAVLINTGKADFLDKGLTPDQTINFINSFCVTETLTKNDFKTAIDNGNTFLTDIKTGIEINPDPLYPNDRSKDITTIVSHSVSVIGYDEDDNFIYIDPAEGKAQIAPSSEMGFSYSIIIKGKK